MTNNTTANDTKKFSGICQVCGRRQAVTAKGKLAKHGYTLDYGFFNGTCPGSDNLPFEQSKELAEGIIVHVHEGIATLEEEATNLEAVPSSTDVAWVHEFIGSRKGGSSYAWRQVPVTFEFATREHGRYEGDSIETAKWIPMGQVEVVTKVSWERSSKSTVTYRTPSTEPFGYDVPYQERTKENAVRVLNTSRAKVLRRNAEGQRSWIKWQEERCASWTPKALEVRK